MDMLSASHYTVLFTGDRDESIAAALTSKGLTCFRASNLESWRGSDAIGAYLTAASLFQARSLVTAIFEVGSPPGGIMPYVFLMTMQKRECLRLGAHDGPSGGYCGEVVPYSPDYVIAWICYEGKPTYAFDPVTEYSTFIREMTR